MKTILNWIDDRTGLCTALSRYFHTPIPGGACPCKALPGAILFCFLIQGMTGLVMWMYYSPSARTAWESVYFLQFEVPGGWLLRAVHHYSAQVLLVLIGIYLLQMVFTRAYRAPRELLFWLAVFMGIFCLCLLLTGDLLAWDLNSRQSTKVRAEFLNLLPVVGEPLYKLAAGGCEFGHASLTRFLVLHIAVFGGGFLVLWILHNLLLRRLREKEARRTKSTPFWPEQAAVNALAWVVVLIIVLGLAVQHGVSGPDRGLEMGAPAAPGDDFPAARPEWPFRGLYAFSEWFPGELKIVPIFVVPGILLLVVLAMPWIGRTESGYWFNNIFAGFLLVQMTLLTVDSFRHDRNDGTHQDALAAARKDADRVLELTQSPKGIPATGAMTLLREDPLTRGPKIFKDNCASCHNCTAADGTRFTAEEPSAPELTAFASREWIAGLLDPKRIRTAKYFGNTKFRKGKMAGFVRERFGDLEDEDKEDVEMTVMALSAEANLASQSDLDLKDAKLIDEGKVLVDDWGCTGCHKFHASGQLGEAPNLTGYGSREWLIGIIADPAHLQFYGEDNDRMPAYAETLSEKEIEVVAKWLRGEWHKPEQPTEE